MEEQIAIRVNNISKKFTISGTEFYALQNISFDVKKGEILGVIGSNGSGKSTLLKVLSEVLKPSAGQAEITGHVTSILEVGNNFHPDLTGRENVEMQFRLQGTDKKDYASLHKQIKAFSEIGEFYDQAVKIYSAGMFLRLAFSMALNSSTDILILDEVLSVGDEGFRLKCKDLLGKFADEGKTIVFVSHNRAEVQELATNCLWLHKGHIKKIGKPDWVLGEYFTMHKDNHDAKKNIVDTHAYDSQKTTENFGTIHINWPANNAPNNDIMSIRHISVLPVNSKTAIYHNDSIRIKFVIDKKKKGIQIGAFFFLQDMFYQPIMVGHFLNNSGGSDLNSQIKNEVGLIEINCVIPAHFLIPGKYFLLPRFGMEENEWNPQSQEAFRFSETLSFTIQAPKDYVDFVGDASKGVVRPLLDWKINKMDN